jgi:hypothetical protein
MVAPRDPYAAGMWAALILGAGLRTWQYLAGGSLWLDEVALARPILDLDLASLLTGSLPHAQVAPKGFLLLEKLVITAFGTGDHALRLLPFAASLGALLAFRSLARRVLDGAGPLIATTLFAVAPSLVAYGGTLKQYSSDVTVCVLLLWLALALADRAPAGLRSAGAAVAGAAAVWFSQPALLVLGSLGVALAWTARAQPVQLRAWRGWLLIAAAWTASAGAAAWVSLHSVDPEVMAYQTRFWKEGYPPQPFAFPLDLFWPIDRLSSLYGGTNAASLGYPVRALFLVLTGIGAVALWRRERTAALLLLAPFCAALAAASLRLYPFSSRLILYLVPVLLLALAAGIEQVRRLASARALRLGNAVAAGLVLLAAAPVALRHPPYDREDVTPVLSYLREQRRPGDAIYVYYDIAPAVTFYAARYGLADDDFLVGGCHRQENRRYLAELDSFRGRSRVWAVITHSSRAFEGQDLVTYLDALGVRLERIASDSRGVRGDPRPAELYLYDLSDPRRFEGVDRNRFAMRSQPEADEPCVGTLEIVPSEF